MAEVWVEVFSPDMVGARDTILFTIIHRGPDGERSGGSELPLPPWIAPWPPDG